MSVTAESVPRVLDNATVPPLMVRLLPFASSSRTVIAIAATPFAFADVGVAVTVEVATDGAPGVKVTEVVLVRSALFNFPLMVAAPAVVDVSVAEYVPFALSVTAESVPRVVDKATVPPLTVRLLPLASFSWTWMAIGEAPSAVAEAGVALMTDVDSEAAPATKATVAVDVIGPPFSVPVIVAVPTDADEVNVAVYTPLPPSATLESVPRVVDSVTVAPPTVTPFPAESFNCTEITVVDIPSATIEVCAAVMVDVLADAGPTTVNAEAEFAEQNCP